MFVPLALLAQDESMLYTPEDVILALDRWVLPRYKNHTSDNPSMTKVECMGVLLSFHHAGKFHLSLKPVEIEQAVDAFMEDRLWVPRSVTETLILPIPQRPESWMAQPTIGRILIVIPKVIMEAAAVIYSLFKASATYTWYSFKQPRGVTIPNPTEHELTNLTLLKKDS